jgi:hypothetical protein
MPTAHDKDLLIVARQRVAFFDVVQRFDRAADVEIRLDRRRMERRRAPEPGTSEERRRRDRRALDVSEQLRSVGWILIPAAQRSEPWHPAQP